MLGVAFNRVLCVCATELKVGGREIITGIVKRKSAEV